MFNGMEPERSGDDAEGAPEGVSEANQQPGAGLGSQDGWEVRYECCTPGYLDFARYRSVEGRSGNRPCYADVEINRND